jgi:hypothetical protein
MKGRRGGRDDNIMMEFRFSWEKQVNGTGLGSCLVVGCDIAKL